MDAIVIILDAYFRDARKTKTETKQIQMADEITNIVSKDLKDLENSYNYISSLNNTIFSKIYEVNSMAVTKDIISSIILLRSFINCDFFENNETFTKSINYLRQVLHTATMEIEVKKLAASVYGLILRKMGSSAGEVVDFEVSNMLIWLDSTSREALKQISTLLLKEIAENAPTLFNVHVIKFLDPIWTVLRNHKQQTRMLAVLCLGEFLVLLGKREVKQRNYWYYYTYSEALAGLQKDSVENTHSSLAVIGELIKFSGDYMKANYKEACKIVMGFRHHRDRVITRTVVKLIPLLARYSPEEFCQTSMDDALEFFLVAIKMDKHRDIGFEAIAETIFVVKDRMKFKLVILVNLIKEALTISSQTAASKNAFLPNVYSCVSILAEAFKQDLLPFTDDLVDKIFENPLSEGQVTAVYSLLANIKELHFIEKRLDLNITEILKRNSNKNTKTELKTVRVQHLSSLIKKATEENPANFISVNFFKRKSVSEPKAESLQKVCLALKAVRTFGLFKNSALTSLRTLVAPYLDNARTDIREEAALSCADLLLRVCEKLRSLTDFERVIVSEILERMMAVGVSDMNEKVRVIIFESLHKEFDIFLSQEDFLNSLFISINDENFKIRAISLKILGRLIKRNPAFVYPSLRKVLVYLISEVEYSKVPSRRAESVSLLGLLFESAPKLSRNYTLSVLDVLLPCLKNDDVVATSVLSTIGSLSKASSELMRPYHKTLMPIIISIIENKNSSLSRRISLRTLRDMFESFADVVWPYSEYQNLMSALLDCLKPENDYEVRREASKLIGFLGAWNPENYNENEDAEKVTYKPFMELPPYRFNDKKDIYFTYVVVNAMIKILHDEGLSGFHDVAIETLMFIVHNSKECEGNFVPNIVQVVLSILFRKIKANQNNNWLADANADESHSSSLLKSLTFFVPLAEMHIKKYLDDIFDLVKRFWDVPSVHLFLMLIFLIEEISKTLNNSFSIYLVELVPLMLKTIHFDSGGERLRTIYVLHAFRIFDKNLEDYLFLIIPDLIGQCERISTPDKVCKSALLTLCKICEKFDVRQYSSRILHCYIRLLNQKSAEIKVAINTIFHVIFQLESYQRTMFVSVFDKVMASNGVKDELYNTIVSKLLKNKKFNYRDNLYSIDEIDLNNNNFSDIPNIKISEKLELKQNLIKTAWNASERATREDWVDWMRCLSLELVKENPSPAIRHCHNLVLKHPMLGRELFNPAFVSCWMELDSNYQDDFIFNIENVFGSSKIPHEIVHVLLNLVEFMERSNMALPIRVSTLGKLSEKIQSYAKALHYKEIDFYAFPTESAVESMLYIYNQLQQPESADGMLEFALKCNIELKESLYEKLRRWENALEAYEKNSMMDPSCEKSILGRLRCLDELGEWKRLSALTEGLAASNSNSEFLEALAPIGATAAWSLGNWESMEKFVSLFKASEAKQINGVSEKCSFFEAVLAVHKNEFEAAEAHIETTRKSLDSELTSLVGESYNRAYPVIAKLQKLVELEEVVAFKKLSATKVEPVELEKTKTKLKVVWDNRLKGCARNIDVWHQLLWVRSLVITPKENIDTQLRYSSLCRRKGLLSMSLNTICSLLDIDANCKSNDIFNIKHHNEVKYVYLKHLWDAGLQKDSLNGLTLLIGTLDKHDALLKAKCLLRYGECQKTLLQENFEDPIVYKILDSFEEATHLHPKNHKAFHMVALMNYKIADFKERVGQHEESVENLTRATRNFFSSLSLDILCTKTFAKFQDALRVISIMFKSGSIPSVRDELIRGFERIRLEIWLDVIPQIIARINCANVEVTELVHLLLLKISKVHPQALIYPLTVAKKSANAERKKAANSILDKMKEQNSKLVEQALLISRELIRVAILWPEQCIEELKEASRFYLKSEYDPMYEILDRLNLKIVNSKAVTLSEIEFKQSFGADFQTAHDYIKKFKDKKSKCDLDEAWAVYCSIFKGLQARVDAMNDLDFADVSPALLKAENLELLVPGKYTPKSDPILITRFAPKISVINSKRKPRKLSIIGSDGRRYPFLLKGLEDLRQDERVTQIFGLINTIFEQTRETNKSSLSIRRYSVVPLSPNTGLIEWVPNCDTLYELIKESRLLNFISTKTELNLLKSDYSVYHSLTLPQKMHAFERVYSKTSANDLRDVLWAKSKDSESWFERRTTYSRSLAVMSMVGYVLGLGDRHPCNLMLDRQTGKVIHIDFGDCFEVAMERSSFPEKVPFRLTRTMVNALGASGVEGLFRSTCETVMKVLRDNKESLLTVLEAFVYDPLINWRLMEKEEEHNDELLGLSELSNQQSPIRSEIIQTFSSAQPGIKSKYQQTFKVADKAKEHESLNEKSMKVMQRITDKLTGRDFGSSVLNKKQQVNELILQATSVKNLSQCYAGWCPFW